MLARSARTASEQLNVPWLCANIGSGPCNLRSTKDLIQDLHLMQWLRSMVTDMLPLQSSLSCSAARWC